VKNEEKWPKITGGVKWDAGGQNGTQVGQNGTSGKIW
jgi:hypothetical protein